MSKKQVSFSNSDWFESMFRHLKKSPMAPRDCAYCFDRFTPSRNQDRDAKFCKKDCREAFYRYGGLPMRILLRPLEAQMMALVKRIIRSTVEEVVTKQLRKAEDIPEPVVAPKKKRRTKKQIFADERARDRADIMAALKNGRPLTAAEIATQSGVSVSALTPVIESLLASADIVVAGGSAAKTTYAIPEKTEAAS